MKLLLLKLDYLISVKASGSIIIMICTPEVTHLVHESLEKLFRKEDYIFYKVCYGAIFYYEHIVVVYCVGIKGAFFNIELVAWIYRKA